MIEPQKEIELSKRDYRAQGIKGEPFFSFGWPIGVAALITIGSGTLFHGTPFWIHIIGGIAGATLAAVFREIFMGET